MYISYRILNLYSTIFFHNTNLFFQKKRKFSKDQIQYLLKKRKTFKIYLHSLFSQDIEILWVKKCFTSKQNT